MKGAAAPAGVAVAHKLTLALALLGAGGAGAAGQGRAAAGILAGAAVMALCLQLTAWRALRLGRQPGGRGRSLLLAAAQAGKFGGALAIFWLLVYKLQAPPWSLLAGITLAVGSMVVAFGRRQAAE
jgi:hypothetical protein